VRDSGFTLVEVLVALAIFSLAALALLRLQGVALSTTARLDERTLAAIVAQNQAIEAVTAPRAPSIGTSAGQETVAGRPWRWSRTVSRAPDARLQRIDVRVAGPDGGTAASLTMLRPAE
jgi:general secretion pathway protein I